MSKLVIPKVSVSALVSIAGYEKLVFTIVQKHFEDVFYSRALAIVDEMHDRLLYVSEVVRDEQLLEEVYLLWDWRVSKATNLGDPFVQSLSCNPYFILGVLDEAPLVLRNISAITGVRLSSQCYEIVILLRGLFMLFVRNRWACLERSYFEDTLGILFAYQKSVECISRVAKNSGKVEVQAELMGLLCLALSRKVSFCSLVRVDVPFYCWLFYSDEDVPAGFDNCLDCRDACETFAFN